MERATRPWPRPFGSLLRCGSTADVMPLRAITRLHVSTSRLCRATTVPHREAQTSECVPAFPLRPQGQSPSCRGAGGGALCALTCCDWALSSGGRECRSPAARALGCSWACSLSWQRYRSLQLCPCNTQAPIPHTHNHTRSDACAYPRLRVASDDGLGNPYLGIDTLLSIATLHVYNVRSMYAGTEVSRQSRRLRGCLCDGGVLLGLLRGRFTNQRAGIKQKGAGRVRPCIDMSPGPPPPASMADRSKMSTPPLPQSSAPRTSTAVAGLVLCRCCCAVDRSCAACYLPLRLCPWIPDGRRHLLLTGRCADLPATQTMRVHSRRCSQNAVDRVIHMDHASDVRVSQGQEKSCPLL